MQIVTWEPLLVTTLRHYRRRGASTSLLKRLAGGPRDWRLLNESWGLDNRTVAAPAYQPVLLDERPEPIKRLSLAERRIALLQLVADYAAANAIFPTDAELGLYFGVSRTQIWLDIGELKEAGRLSFRVSSDGNMRTRRVLRLPGAEHSTADPNDLGAP